MLPVRREIRPEWRVLSHYCGLPHLPPVGTAHAHRLTHFLLGCAAARHHRIFDADEGPTRDRVPDLAGAWVGECRSRTVASRSNPDVDAKRRTRVSHLAAPNRGRPAPTEEGSRPCTRGPELASGQLSSSLLLRRQGPRSPPCCTSTHWRCLLPRGPQTRAGAKGRPLGLTMSRSVGPCHMRQGGGKGLPRLLFSYPQQR